MNDPTSLYYTDTDKAMRWACQYPKLLPDQSGTTEFGHFQPLMYHD